MAEQKRGGGAMLPLIIVGATLFAFGAYQSTRPKEVDVNKGFEAPVSAPQNPRTIQAPDNPPMTKDAAQKAAEVATTTAPSPITATSPAPSQLDKWVKAFSEPQIDFRRASLTKLKDFERDGTLTCSPVLTTKSEVDLAKVLEVICLTKDGSKIEGTFEEDYQLGNGPPIMSDGVIEITEPGAPEVKIVKNGDEFFTKGWPREPEKVR